MTAPLLKVPQAFKPGDVIKRDPNIPYTGVPIKTVTVLEHTTGVVFESDEIVSFYNNIVHEMQE